MPNNSYPVYNRGFEKGMNPGLYLALYNGHQSQTAREQAQGEVGQPGPVIGPLDFADTFQAGAIRIHFIDAAADIYAPFLTMKGDQRTATIWVNANDQIEFDGVRYSNWICFCLDGESLRQLQQEKSDYEVWFERHGIKPDSVLRDLRRQGKRDAPK